MNELNNPPTLSIGFNKNLLKLESTNIGNEKYQYIVDILLNEMLIQYVFDAVTGYPQFAGYTALQGANIADKYTSGDSVIFFDVTNDTITGIYKVLATPDNSTVIIDLLWGGVGFFLGEGWLFRLYRNKLPQLPDGTATFNINGFVPGNVSYHFLLEDSGMFNIFENFIRFKYLSNEEFYTAIGFQDITNSGNNILIQNNSRVLEIGSIVQIIQSTGSTYNGTFEVLNVSGNDMTISALYQGDYIGTGIMNVLPKDVTNDLLFADVSEPFFAFNGALPFPQSIQFDYVDYDATQTQLCKFLTNIPNDTKVFDDSKGYLQFFQSNKNTCSQYVVDIVDQLNVTHQYVININGVLDNILGISIGPQDLNAIDPLFFDSFPARGLPIVQDCDKSYEVYLQGSLGCDVDGIQAVQFNHPDGNNGFDFLSSNYWDQQNWASMQVQPQLLKIGGVVQFVTPTGTIFTKATVTAQTREDIYADELELQTGLTVRNATEIDASVPYVLFGSPLEITIDFDLDFELNMRIVIERRPSSLEKPIPPPPVVFDIQYKWDIATCSATYTINGIESLGGFIGLVGNPALSPIVQLSEKKNFVIDWGKCDSTKARLIFEDRLGSFPGFNFPLKSYKQQDSSSDGFEIDSMDLDRTAIDAGFETIQTSYTDSYVLNTDYLTQAEMNYIVEAFTSPKAFIQIDGVVMPCKILTTSKQVQSKKNQNLIIDSIEVIANGTNYTQRN